VEGRRVVVVGAARSGVAAAELLVRKGARVTLTERRTAIDGGARLRGLGVDLELGTHREETLAGADLVVLSPGVPPGLGALEFARARGVEVIGELELASRWIRGPIVAVTGTKGKSTTTEVVARMLDAGGRRALAGGNIGVPLSAQVEASTSDTVHVVEASSFQLETTTTFRPWVAVWLNCSADHLDRHPTLEAYAAAKARIFANQRPEDWAVVNGGDRVALEASARTAARVVRFWPADGGGDGFGVDGAWIVRRTSTASERLFPTSAVALTGRHLLDNVVAAAAVGWIAGVSPAAMARALEGFAGLEHVMEPAGEIAGVRFVNDSKATNVAAASRSIESFDRVVAIVGGVFKGGDLRELRPALSDRGRAIVAIGEAATLVRQALADLLPVIEAGSMREAVARAYEAAAPDGTVLLAPACASFDWFRDYAERGRVFKEEVRRLRERAGASGT
jgi:UDP-N-acetylmuramoylalanine--D-glutamate ligase